MNAGIQSEIVSGISPQIETSVEEIRRRLPALIKEVECLVRFATGAESECDDDGQHEMSMSMYELRTGLEDLLEDVINEVYRDMDWED